MPGFVNDFDPTMFERVASLAHEVAGGIGATIQEERLKMEALALGRLGVFVSHGETQMPNPTLVPEDPTIKGTVYLKSVNVYPRGIITNKRENTQRWESVVFDKDGVPHVHTATVRMGSDKMLVGFMIGIPKDSDRIYSSFLKSDKRDVGLARQVIRDLFAGGKIMERDRTIFESVPSL